MSALKNVLFVTGTDTGVGKTTVSCLLLRELVRRGRRVGVLKPVETGCCYRGGAGLFAEDGHALWQAAGMRQDEASVVPYKFRSPVAPLAAQQAEPLKIDLAHLRRRVAEEARKHELLLLEGAGGLLVPIADKYTYADLARDCSAVALVVVSSKLGALNHALLTFSALNSWGIAACGYVLNDYTAVSQDELRQDAVVTARQTNRQVLSLCATNYRVPEVCSLGLLETTPATQTTAEIMRLATAVLEYFKLKE